MNEFAPTTDTQEAPEHLLEGDPSIDLAVPIDDPASLLDPVELVTTSSIPVSPLSVTGDAVYAVAQALRAALIALEAWDPRDEGSFEEIAIGKPLDLWYDYDNVREFVGDLIETWARRARSLL